MYFAQIKAGQVFKLETQDTDGSLLLKLHDSNVLNLHTMRIVKVRPTDDIHVKGNLEVEANSTAETIAAFFNKEGA